MNNSRLALVIGVLVLFILTSSGYSKDNNSLPKLLLPPPAWDMTCNVVSSGQTCELYLIGNIEGPSDYLGLYKALKPLRSTDTLQIHLAGDGGRGDGLLYLLNMLKLSPVKKVVYIDGTVISAHAALATSFGTPVIIGEGFILFHNISGSGDPNVTCSEISGLDRGLPKFLKCVEDTKKIADIYNKNIRAAVQEKLTKEELKQFDLGYDVILDLQEFKKRYKY